MYLVFSLLIVRSAAANETEANFQIRIEPGMHTASIRSLAADPAGTFLVTASEDKTARVWSAASGEALAILRPPTGAGNEGNLYAVAVSPDGRSVVVGGWTDDENSLYFFDRASGRMTRRIAGLSGVVSSLAFSPDGRFLAVGMAQEGVRLFLAVSGLPIGEDRGISGRIHGLVWSGSRLMAASLDGKVTVWESSADGLRRVDEQVVPGGRSPYGIALSPSGDKIAVGYTDTRAVTVLDAKTLKPGFAAEVFGVNNGNLSSVAWSDDGDTLWAAGQYQRPMERRWQTVLRRWSAGGTGVANSTAVADRAVASLVALPGGKVAYASFDPSWGVIDAEGERVLSVGSPVREFRGNRAGHLYLSGDARALRIGSLEFSLATRQFAGANGATSIPRQTADGLKLDQWVNSETPRLNGKLLALRPYEVSRSVAVASDAQSFAMGAEWSVRRIDRGGNEQWQRPVPGVPWAVNLADNNRILVIALGDGTIRWHRYEDGRELLALYAHPDNRRWVLWTPSGYYDSSAGAEGLIGFHVNRGKERAADFVPAARLSRVLRRPDVIDRVLVSLDESEALRQANLAAGRKTHEVLDEKGIRQLILQAVTP